MDRFSAIRVFAKVVESGSFARAAEHLGISTTAASRQVAELEAHLQTRLLQRTTRRVSLTESGRLFYERAVQLLADLEEAEHEAARVTIEPRGTIRLTAPIAFGARYVTPAIAEFLARHRDVRFDVSLSDRTVDIVEEALDLAIRIGGLGSETLVARRLGETRAVACAAPSYLARHGTPRSPEELEAHNCLTYAYAPAPNLWRFTDAEGREHAAHVSGNLYSNSGDQLAAACSQGVGVTLQPGFIVGPDIRAGRLVELLRDYQGARLPIYAVYASRKHLSAKVRAFVDFLAARFAAIPDWLSPPGDAWRV